MCMLAADGLTAEWNQTECRVPPNFEFATDLVSYSLHWLIG